MYAYIQIPYTIRHFRHLEWHNLEAVVGEDNTIRVKDVLTDAEEHLGEYASYTTVTLTQQSPTTHIIELHDRIVKVALGWGHLVAITPLQGFIYK